LLSRLPVDEPVDNWMAGFCAERQIKAYCIRPKIVLQADAWNINSDVAHSDEHYWGPNSDIQHSDDVAQGLAEPRSEEGQFGLPTASSLLGPDHSDSEDSEDGL